MKSPQRTYVLLDVRFKPARNPGDAELVSAYFSVAGEIEAPNLAAAFRLAKRRRSFPIIEEKHSFWSRIEAARLLTAVASPSLYPKQGTRHGHS
jgi:hypothetical protein